MFTPRKAWQRNLIQMGLAICFLIAARVLKEGWLILVWIGLAVVLTTYWARVTLNNPDFE